jgi:hypothetical protein
MKEMKTTLNGIKTRESQKERSEVKYYEWKERITESGRRRYERGRKRER